MKLNKIALITFILFLTICILTPISGDDYGNYISTNGTIYEAISIAKSNYYTLEGRFISRIIILYTTYHKILWNLITPGLFTLLIYYSSKFLNKKTSHLILLLGILFMNNDMFAQSYTWLAGSITYLYPSCLIIFYFSYIYFKHNKFKTIDYILLTILSIIIPMFVENLACSFVLGTFIILIYTTITDKKINYIYLINFLLSTIFLIIMLKSPGSAQRALTENINFNNYNILQKIIHNIPNYNLYLFFKNSTMIILTLIPIEYYLIKNSQKLKAIIFSIIPIISIINNMYYMLPMKFSFLQNINIINTSNPIYIIYWAIYIIILIKTINYIIKHQKLKHFIFFILTTSFSSTIIMLILPTWGDRITLFNVLVMTIVGIILIDNIIEYNEKIIKFIKTITILTCIYFVIIFVSIYQINNYREKTIEKEINENKEQITIIRNPFIYLWNNNPSTKYFIDTYKIYMNIPNSLEINIYQLPHKEYIKIILGVKKWKRKKYYLYLQLVVI